ncbi:MAG: DUF1727 domain-containing protein [Solobacterium sp.]|nr:DUF1727 domain-containing protein [Solobacterium sp.]
MSIVLKFVKATHYILSKVGRGGSLPGQLALMMDSNILSKFKMPKEVILVTGTNGKTTTSNLIAESLRQTGKKVINNHRGDNLNVGITTLLALNAKDDYTVDADIAVIEIDELTVYRQFHNLHPTALVVTNFFRDQLDRAGEMETIIRRIMEVTENFEGRLILNGDDPNVLRIAENAKKANVYLYSVGENEVSVKETDEASEGKFCPICGNPLQYQYYQYSHIGRFECPKDHYGKIRPSVFVNSIDYNKGTFTYDNNEYHSFINAIYAIYNCAATLTVMKALGFDPTLADEVFQHYQLKEGRNEVFNLKKPCVINLFKNPTGANEVMKEIVKHEGDMNICILLNDKDQDGHDVSWIWDAHFERFNIPQVKKICCSGTRAYDMALRLKYEGLEDRIIVKENPQEAIHWLNEENIDSYVLATYTALHSTRTLLRKEEKQ